MLFFFKKNIFYIIRWHCTVRQSMESLQGGWTSCVAKLPTYSLRPRMSPCWASKCRITTQSWATRSVIQNSYNPFKTNHPILVPPNNRWCFSSLRIAYHKHTSEPIKWLKNRHVLLEGLTLITWEGDTDYVEALSPLWFLVFREDGKFCHFNLPSFSFNFNLSSFPSCSC